MASRLRMRSLVSATVKNHPPYISKMKPVKIPVLGFGGGRPRGPTVAGDNFSYGNVNEPRDASV
jgi:hypothetical protein